MIEHATAFVEADLGLTGHARVAARHANELARSISDEITSIGSLSSLGHAELAAGELDAAIAVLRPLPERHLRTGHHSCTCDPWVDTIEVLIALGELNAAEEHLTRYRTLPSMTYRRGRVGAARNEGLLHAARGDKDAARLSLQEALAADDPPMYPLEHGRTLLALGTVQRQALQRRAARETLNDAVALFESLGATPWAEKGRAELARISGRGAAASCELTNAERHVAELAAEGRKNKEIAAAMFVTVGTVEAHLSRVYRKLGVRSRAELAGRFTRNSTVRAGDPTAQR
jgi:DNA-binding CsgD family transcriptional regulator